MATTNQSSATPSVGSAGAPPLGVISGGKDNASVSKERKLQKLNHKIIKLK
jgi:hypothetical protein